jgi:hypothetical protein
LCFSCEFFGFNSTRRVGFGDPITFRAADFTAAAALNLFFFLVRFVIA